MHRPAEVGGDPVVSVYRTPSDPIGPGKARVLLAHTATTAPADVSVDGKVVFTNIANGEYAEADVAGRRPPGLAAAQRRRGGPDPRPARRRLDAGAVTMVYAVGNPRNGSMDVVVREADLSADGTSAPTAIETGSAGWAALFDVVPFRSGH